MASNNNAEVSTERKNNADHGDVLEKRVGTVDHQSTPAAGQQGEVERTRDVKVVHHYHASAAKTGGAAGGLVADAAASVASMIRSSDDAVSGKSL